jgi:hypothetical protein
VQLTHRSDGPARITVDGTILEVQLAVALLACRLGVHLLTLSGCALPASKAMNSSGTETVTLQPATGDGGLGVQAESESAPGSQRVGGRVPQAGTGLQLVQSRGRASAVSGPGPGAGRRRGRDGAGRQDCIIGRA